MEEEQQPIQNETVVKDWTTTTTKTTTIKVTKQMREHLSSLKKDYIESYNDILIRLIKKSNKYDELVKRIKEKREREKQIEEFKQVQ